jgi:O-antigen/teichoic acid export membrane protein
VKYFAKAIAAFSAGSFLGTVTQVVKGKLSAILLGAEGVGILSQLANAWGLLHAISGLGFYNGLVRRISEAEKGGDSIGVSRQLSTSLFVLTVFSCATTVLGVVFSPIISAWLFADAGERAWLVAITLISVPLGVTAQTYRGLLSGHRLVKPIVQAQVASDVLGLAVFIVLILSAHLTGAAIAFSILQLIKLCLQIRAVGAYLPGVARVPNLSLFEWKEVRVNIGIGASSLFMTSIAIVTLLVVSRWIIAGEGLEANGQFSVAWKVSSVYLGALYASASAFYFPTLAACTNDGEMKQKVNEAISLYFFIIPPFAVTVSVAGGFLMLVLFSAEFAPAAYLLALLLVGDMFRITSEAIGMTFLAKNRPQPYSVTYLVWAVSFLALAYAAMPAFGVVGVAAAYLISQMINSLVVYFSATRIFQFSFSPQALRAFTIGVVAVGSSGVLVFLNMRPLLLYVTGASVLAVWGIFSWQDKAFRTLLVAAFRKLKVRN